MIGPTYIHVYITHVYEQNFHEVYTGSERVVIICSDGYNEPIVIDKEEQVNYPANQKGVKMTDRECHRNQIIPRCRSPTGSHLEIDNKNKTKP